MVASLRESLQGCSSNQSDIPDHLAPASPRSRAMEGVFDGQLSVRGSKVQDIELEGESTQARG